MSALACTPGSVRRRRPPGALEARSRAVSGVVRGSTRECLPCSERTCPDFLTLPTRTAQAAAPRDHARPGQGPARGGVDALLGVCGAYVDVWKFGWGTAYLDPGLPAKLRPAATARRARLHRRHAARDRVAAGRRRAVSWTGRRTSASRAWRCRAASRRIPARRRSGPRSRRSPSGSSCSPRSGPRTRRGGARPRPGGRGSGARTWQAGAHWVVTEGRESGTVGLFDAGRRGARGRRRRRRRAPSAWSRGLRGAAQGAAGLADQPVRRRRQPGATSRRPRRSGSRRCGSGCAPTRSTPCPAMPRVTR